MTAHIVRDVISNEIAMACEECGIMGEWLENRDGNRVVVSNMVTTHNSAKHWENPLKPFQAAILTLSDFNGHTPHMVTGQDFTESPKEEGEDKAMKILSDALRVKNMRIKQLESEAVERETLNTEMRQTIQELLETPDPMPLCKSLDGHNYVPLDQMFVFCTRCGHSIHYKTK
jgi:hypothetical protein